MVILMARSIRPLRPRLAAFTALAILLALGFGFGATQAQDAADAVVTRPAHIHVGTCAELDPNPIAPLRDVAPVGYNVEDGAYDDDQAPEVRGALDAPTVLYSESEGDVSWDDVLGTSHAINVHESNENIQTYIACGDIGGPVKDDKVYVALQPQNDSGFFGIAIVEEADDDKVKVTIYLTQPLPTGEETPAAEETPEPETPEANGTPEA
jgi:hypothetical protein